MPAKSIPSKSVDRQPRALESPWELPGHAKEMWKKLPGNRYSVEEIRTLRSQTGFSLSPRRRLSL